MTTTTPKRRWLQFGLKTLLFLIVLCALVLTWWRQWKQNSELIAMRFESRMLESEVDFLRHFHEVMGTLDLDKPEHRKVFANLRKMHAGWFATSVAKWNGQRAGNRLEVMTFHYDTFSSPGCIRTVAVLLRDGELIDAVTREDDPRGERHEVALEDANNDGNIDVVLRCYPGVWRPGPAFTIIYEITGDGFREFSQDAERKVPSETFGVMTESWSD